MSKTKPTLIKPELHRQLEQARAKHGYKPGDRVEYSVPPVPISHLEKNGRRREIAVPVGDEQWFPARVKAVEHHPRTVAPDDHVLVLEPDDGSAEIALAAFLVRPGG